MSDEQLGAGFTVAGKLIESISPALAAIPIAGPIAVVVGEIAGELLGMAGAGFSAREAALADVLAKATALRDALRDARATTEAAEDERDAETERLIAAAEKKLSETGGALPIPLIASSSPDREDPTKPGG